jgi:hypothetical protein
MGGGETVLSIFDTPNTERERERIFMVQTYILLEVFENN